MRGSYSYVGPDGVTYTTHYIADRNGYRAYGAHLPKQPHEVIDETERRLQLPLRQHDYYSATTSRPHFIEVSPKLSSSFSLPTLSPYQSNSIVVVPTPNSFISPPFKSYTYHPSSSPSVLTSDRIFSTTTIRPLYSTGKYFDH